MLFFSEHLTVHKHRHIHICSSIDSWRTEVLHADIHVRWSSSFVHLSFVVRAVFPRRLTDRLPCVVLRNDVTSEFRFVDISVSFRLEELLMKFVCSLPCNIFLLLLPLCTFLVVRWCIWRYSVLAVGLDHVRGWNFVSESCSLLALI